MHLNRFFPAGTILGIIILLFLLPLKTIAQIDNTFWFVAPEVTSDHGDESAVLRLTAFDNDAEVTIAMPANPDFDEKTVNVAANTQKTFEFDDADIVENKPAGQQNGKGILITSDVDISAYYEVTAGNNPDKFTLKGDNALGTEFFVPSQNAFRNHSYSTPAREHVDIVATEDGTQVEITVSDEVEGHSAGSTFTVNLDRGETYSLTASSEAASRHLGGTQITSNKSITVTISDDSVEVPDEAGCWDLIGDQLIPVNVLGSEYVVMNPVYGQGVSNGVHKVFVLAVEDGTYLYANGDDQPKTQLEQGELHELDITENALFLDSNKPFYAYQVTGIPQPKNNPPPGVELGSAILPNITCTGSSSVSFTRTLNQRFYVQLMTEERNRDAFQIDGDGSDQSDFPDNLNWVQVPGTGNNGTDETWYTASVELGGDGTGLSTNSPYTITNTEGIFHLSIFDENNVSMSFGYFSDYTNLRIYGYEMTCVGETLTLETRDPDGTYYWYYEDDIYNPITENPTPSIEVNKPGKYWVKEYGGCFQTDTVDVQFSMPEFSLGNDTAVCPGERLTWEIEANDEDDEFLWQPGNVTSNQYEITPGSDEEVEVTLTMTDALGCSKSDTVTVTGYSPPVIDWNISGEDICLGDTLKTETEMDGYQWTIDGNTDPADTLSYIVPDHSGEYELTVYTEDNCSETKTLDLKVHDLPQPNLNDVSECPGEETTFNPGKFETYLWHDNSTNSSYTATSSEKVKVTVTDSIGCVASDSANFEWYNESVFTFGEDTSVCINDNIHIAVDDIAANGVDYEWTFSKKGTGSEQDLDTITTHELDITDAAHSHEGSYTVATVDKKGCNVEDEFYLTVQDVPELRLEDAADICPGDTIEIATQDHRFEEFEWRDSDGNLLSEENSVLVYEADTLELTAWQANRCSQSDTTVATINEESPTFDLNDTTVCPNVDTEIRMQKWNSSQTGNDAEPRNFTWSRGNPRTEYADTEPLENPEEGTYYLTVHDAHCFHTDSVEVTHFELPDIELEDDVFCENETYTLQIPSSLDSIDSSYFWEQNNTSDTVPDSDDMEVSDEGDYTLHITDDNGCNSSDTLTLNHLSAPDFSLGADRGKCPGDTIKIETDPSFTSYEWNGDGSDGQENHTEVSSSTTQSLQVWNEEGCSSRDEITITLHPQPSVDLGRDREACAGETFELAVGDYEEIYWTNGEKNVRSITASEGRHGVRVVNAYGCADEDTIHVRWHPIPEIDLGPDLSICPVEYPVTIEAPAGFERYEWQTGSNNRRIHAQLRDTVNMVKVWDDNNCRGWDTKGVKTINTPGYSLGDDIEACEPKEIAIDAGTEIVREYAGEEDVSYIEGYEWNTGATEQEISVDESGEYHVEVFDGCFYLHDTVQVEYFPSPEIAALDTSIYAQVRILAEDGTKPYQYALDDDSRMQDKSTFKDVEEGTHTVYVEDEKGCRASTQFNIQSEYDISVPGFFTPNNDGHNDTWEIQGIERLPESVISIFDRYGKLLIKYKASDPPWDGEYMGRPVPSDDYWYVIHLKPVDKYLKGNVTIKR